MSKHNIEIDEPGPFELEDDQPQGKPLYVHAGLLMAKLGLLWSHRRWIVGKVLLAMVITAGIAILLPNEYTASVYLNPPSSNPISGINLLIGMKTGGLNLASQMGDMLGLQTPGQLYIRQLQTRTVEDRIINRFDLQRVYRTKHRYQTRKVLEAKTDMTEDRKSGVISISVTDKDPQRAAQIANAYAEELGQLIAGINVTAGRREREYFEAQLAEARGKLDQAQKQLSDFGSKHGTLDITEEGKALVEGAAAIEGQLIAAQAELKGLLQIYTEKHEQVQQVRARIAELTRQLQQLKGTSAAQGSRANATAGSGVDLHPTVKNVWGMATPYLDYYRQVKINEATVETLTQQYELAKLQETYQISGVEVIDPADVPERKSAPHRATMTAAAGLLVWLFCCGYLLLEDWWVRADAEDPWRQLLSPVANKLLSAKHRVRSLPRPWRRKLATDPSEMQ